MEFIIAVIAVLLSLGYSNVPSCHDHVNADGTVQPKPQFDSDCKSACYDWYNNNQGQIKQFLDVNGVTGDWLSGS